MLSKQRHLAKSGQAGLKSHQGHCPPQHLEHLVNLPVPHFTQVCEGESWWVLALCWAYRNLSNTHCPGEINQRS